MGGGNTIDIKLIAKDLASKTINNFRQRIKGIASSFTGAGRSAKAFTGKVAGIGVALTSVLTAFRGFEAVKNFLSSSVDEAADFERAMTTLEIVAPKFGVAVDKAQEAATRLGDELLIGPVAAADSLQNLLGTGLNLPEAEDLLARFTNEAMTGKRAGISLSQAVNNLSFAYKTNESNLMDLSGISQNFDKIIQDGKKSLVKKGVAVEDITEEMAKYEGMIELTNLTLGSAEKFEGTYIDQKARMEKKITDLKIVIGKGLMPVLAELTERIQPLIEKGIEWAKAFDWENLLNNVISGLDKFSDVTKKTFEWIVNNKDIVVATLGAIAIVIGVLAVKALVAFVAAAAPFVIAIAGLAAIIFVLKKAWDDNWGGIQEKTQAAWNYLEPILSDMWTWLQINVPAALAELKRVWEENWPVIRDTLLNAWNTIYPAIYSLWTWLQTNVPLAISELKRVWQTNLLPIFLALQAAWNSIGRPVFNTIRNILAIILIQAINSARNTWNTKLVPIFRILKQGWDSFGAPVFNILRNILTIVIVSAINNLIRNWNRLSSAFSLLRTWYNQYIAPTVRSIKSIFATQIGAAVNIFQSQWGRLRPIIESILGPLRAVSGAISDVLGKASRISGAVSGSMKIEGRATGGKFPSSPFLVGEEGPELIDPSKRMVYSNSDTKKKLGGGGNQISININGYNKDPMTLAREIERVLARKNQNTNLGLNLGR